MVWVITEHLVTEKCKRYGKLAIGNTRTVVLTCTIIVDKYEHYMSTKGSSLRSLGFAIKI